MVPGQRGWIILLHIFLPEKLVSVNYCFMKKLMKLKFKLSIVVLLWGLGVSLSLGQTFGVGIVKDTAEGEVQQLTEQIKTEVATWTKGKGEVVFIEKSADWQRTRAEALLNAYLACEDVDVVVTVGLLSSEVAALQATYKKPVIAVTTLIYDLKVQDDNGAKSDDLFSLSFVAAPLDWNGDLAEFARLFDADSVTVLLPAQLFGGLDDVQNHQVFKVPNVQLSLVPVDADNIGALSFVEATDAVVVGPMLGWSTDEILALYERLNTGGLPSLSIKGMEDLNLGGTATFTPQFSVLQTARATAARIAKVLDGNMSPTELVVEEKAPRRLVVNMESVRKIKRFPTWALMKDAVLLNVEKSTGASLGLLEAISLALEHNLKGKIADHDLLLADQEVKIARSSFLPAMDLGGTAVQLSENLVEASMGQKGSFTVTGSASLKQVLYSESAFAHMAIQKLAAEQVRQSNRETMLGLVAEVVEAYVNVLYAKNNLVLQNENLNRQIQYLDWMRSREALGTAGVSDIHRWQSEVSLARMDFNAAEVALRSAEYKLNQLLNRPVRQSVVVSNSADLMELVVAHQDLMTQCLGDPFLTDSYADFLMERMQLNAPELMRMKTAGDIAERKRKSMVRNGFLPEVALGAGAAQAFVREGVIDNAQFPVPAPPDDLTWNVGLSLSFPLFTGTKRSTELKRIVLEQEKIEWQKEDLLTNFQTGLHSAVQHLQASHKDLGLTEAAVRAAEANYEVVEQAYTEGATNVAALIDAQNVMLRTQTLASNARYRYLMNYVRVERLQGSYSFLMDREAYQEYVDALSHYLNLNQ